MDEAYSYGYNNSRDASTITPRTNVEELVMPDDIGNLPSMHGFIKFPDGFPAARIRLSWKDYPVCAEGFQRVTDMRAAEYIPSNEETAEMGVEGREGDGPLFQPTESREEANLELSEAEREAERLREQVEGSLARQTEEARSQIDKTNIMKEAEEAASEQRDPKETLTWKPSGQRDQRERQRYAQRDVEERAAHGKHGQDALRDQRARADNQESELARENMRGFGAEKVQRDDHGIDDDQEMSR